MVYILVLWDDENGIGDCRATLNEAHARAWLTEHRHEPAMLAGVALEGADDLWAAIGDLERAAVEDAMTGDDDALVQARAQVRALLGMEAE